MCKQQNRIFDILITLALIAMVSFGAYVYVERQDWQRFMRYHYYAMQLWASDTHYTCSSEAPKWMHSVLVNNTRYLEAAGNQISYIDPQGEQHHCVSGGYQDFDDKNRVSNASRFVYASLTKPITSMQVLELVDDEKLELSEKALPVLGDFQPIDERLNSMTVRDLMTHQGGFDRSIAGEPMFQQKDWVWCPDKLQKLNDLELQFEPGEKAVYSNLGYCLLGKVVENTSNENYRDHTLDYLKDKVPAGQFMFIDTQKLPDEVSYDDFYNHIPDFRASRNMQALSAVSGLSGNAKSLAKLYEYMIKQYGDKYIFDNENYHCRGGGDCSRGVLMEKLYENGFQMYINEGSYPGFTGYVIVDEKGGILVSLSNGFTGGYHRRKVIDKIRKHLIEEYQ